MIALILYLFAAFFLGRLLLSLAFVKEKINLHNLALSLIAGFALHLLSSHLLAFVLGNFASTSLMTLIGLLVIAIAYSFATKLSFAEFFSVEKPELTDFISFAVASTLGLCFFFRDMVFGSPDRGHLAIASSIFHNSPYPPAFPTDPDFSLSYYHYGIDLLLVIFRKISGLSVWDNASLVVGLGAFLTFLLANLLFEKLTGKKSFALVAAIILVFYTSINSLQFFLQEFPALFGSDLGAFLQKWLNASWTSVSHVTSQLRLAGQNMGLPIFFAAIIALREFFTNKEAYNPFALLLLTISSFFLYFVYPTYWYPFFIAAFALVVLRFFDANLEKSEKFNQFWLLAFIYLGKFLCFTSSHTSFSGINAMAFAPDLTWVHWGKSYIRYFYDIPYLQKLVPTLDHMQGTRHLSIPLFSSISFREFGPSVLTALVFLVLDIKTYFKTKKIDFSLLLAFIAFACFVVPFIFDFILRPVETSRFLLVAKVFALAYSLVRLTALVKLNGAMKWLTAALVFIILVPGFVSIIPNTKLSVLSNKALTKEQKTLITELEKLHTDKAVMLEAASFEGSYDISSLAGFYGVGGQFFKVDKVTRLTALQTLDPALLKELKVDHVLVDKRYIAKRKLPSFLKPVELESKRFSMLSFDKDYVLPENHKTSYTWALAYQLAETDKLQMIAGSDRKPMKSDNRKQLKAELTEVRQFLVDKNPVMAIWLKEYAVIKDAS